MTESNIPNLLGDEQQPSIGNLLESIVAPGSPGLTAELTKEQSALLMTEESCYQSVSALNIAEQAGMYGMMTVGRTTEETVRIDFLKRGADGKVEKVASFEGRSVIEALLNAGTATHRKFLSEFNGSQLAGEYIKRNLAMDEVRRFKKPTVIVPSKS